MGLRRSIAWMILLLLAIGPAPGSARSVLAPVSDQRLPDGQSLLVLCYHDVVAHRTAGMDPETIETSSLAAQLNWLRTEHYTAVNLDEVVRAYGGLSRLPPRAVLLTFDDGYESTFTQVFPLLQAFHTPAVVALVGQWMETAAGQTVRYGERDLPREDFISWAQALTMAASGLVEFASHSFDLHHGLAGDAAQSQEPAATTRRFLGPAHYENDAAWLERVGSDLERNSRLLESRLGQRPRVIVWPYGRYNHALETLAGHLGMPIGLTLDSGRADRPVPISRLRRLLVDAELGLARFASLVRQEDDAPMLRTIQIDPGPLVLENAAGVTRQLDAWADRIRTLGIQNVVLPALTPTRPSGPADAAYFINRQLPVRADLLGRLAWKIASSTRARVWASVPLDLAAPAKESDGPDRLDELFDDLGKSAYIGGLLFGPAPPGPARKAFIERAAQLAERVRQWQPQMSTALWLADDRDPGPSADIQAALRLHDYVVIGPWTGADREFEGSLKVPSLPEQDRSARMIVALDLDALAAETAVRRAQSLLRAGLPNLWLLGSPLDADEERQAALRPVLSQRSRLGAALPWSPR